MARALDSRSIMTARLAIHPRVVRHALPLALATLLATWLGGTAWAQTPAARALELEAIQVAPPGTGEEFVVRSLLRLSPGDPIRPADLLAARQELEASGQFAELDLYTSRGSRPGAVVLHVVARLDRRVEFETGFGHEPLTGWYLNLLGARWNNPLRHGGHLRFGLRTGLRTSGIYLEGIHPGIDGDRLDLLLDAGVVAEDWLIHDADRLLSQQINRAHLHVGLRKPLGRGWNGTLWLGSSSAEPNDELKGLEDNEDEPAGELVPAPDPENPREKYSNAILEFSRDNRDRSEAWRRGSWTAARLRGSTRSDAAGFWRADIETRRAFPLPGRTALALYAEGVYTGPATPYHLRAVVGGTGSIRGFRDASLSGALGARAAWQLSGEWRAPLLGHDAPTPRVIGFLFADVGEHWDAQGDRSDLNSSLGYGIRIRIPWIQTFGIAAGIPLTPSPTGHEFWVHATLGFAF